MSSSARFFLIDGSSYIYRAYYALGRLSTSRGLPTQAVYGFAQMLRKVVRDAVPDYLCLVFDPPVPSFRKEIYQDYKANRQHMPEELVVQIPYIKDLVRSYRIAQVEVEGYEADDVIAALTRRARRENLEITIVSGDKDLFQLIEDPWVKQWDPQRDKVFGEQEVFERFGVAPRQMVDYLALTGDSSDNVPGVKGVGDKTARQLLAQWGSLDEIYAHLGEISPPSVRHKLAASRDIAYLSRDLVTLTRDVLVPRDLKDFAPRAPDSPELLKLYEALEFKGLAEAVRQELGVDASAPPQESAERLDVEVIRDAEDLDAWLHTLGSKQSLGLELDVSSSDPMAARLRGVALCAGEQATRYVALQESGGKPSPSGPGIPVLRALELLFEKVRRADLELVGDDLKSKWIVFRRHGWDQVGTSFDTMLAGYLLEPGRNSHHLPTVVPEWLGYRLPPLDLASTSDCEVGEGSPGCGEQRAGLVGCYAAAAWHLRPVLQEKLRENALMHLFRTIEMPLVRVLAKMETQGVLVDALALEDLSSDLERLMARKAEMIYEMAKGPFNIQSPKQLAEVLFERLGLRVVKRTKSGPSTDMRVLEELAPEHPIVDYVLNYRSLSKLKGTYADALPKLVHADTGRIHTSFNQAVAATGRLSSSNPNLQNIPIRSEEGRKIRAAFVAPADHLLLSVDYSQIELRILAHYSEDEHLVEAFVAGADVHTRTAAEMLGIAPHEVSPEMRRQAKTINFGIIYGMGPYGLAQRLRITTKTAAAAIERYFDRYRGVRRFIDAAIASAREKGYCETLLGRRRAIPELASKNVNVRQQGERLAVNTPLQGTAADLIKKAMIEVDQALVRQGLRTAMILQVHDELVFEVPTAELDSVKGLVREIMEGVHALRVPLRVDMGWGTNWANAHP